MSFEGGCADGRGTKSLPTPPSAPAKPWTMSVTSPWSAVAAVKVGASSKILLLAQMLLCVMGINLCFGWWSIKQERAITKPYFIADSAFAASMAATAASTHDARRAAAVAAAKSNAPPGKPHAVYLSTVYGISLTQTLAGAIVSAVLVGMNSLLRRSMRSYQQRSGRQRGAKANASNALDQNQCTMLSRRDVQEMLAMGFSNIFGTSLGYAAMRRISYPVALTAKMGKMLPVMFVGFVWYRARYPAKKIASCLLITGGDILVKRHRWNGVSLMMRTNLVSVLCALSLLFVLELGEQPWSWLASFSHHTVTSAMRSLPMSNGALGRALGAWLERASEARHDVFLMSLLSALGQLFIFHTITVFGTLALTAMTLLRKIGSVILSIVVHGHTVHSAQWASLGAVFIGVVLEGYINIQEASLRQGQATTKRAAPQKAAATASPSSSSSAVPVNGTPAPGYASFSAKKSNASEDSAATALAKARVLRAIAATTAAPASSPPKAKKTQ
ncbi:UAA transporter family protein [Leishmania donovani]|uniref:UAA transporter family protein n=1 Tax=Leishmania donovani TaxID=5661 RepID=A0A504XZI4_LEIDO|nr:UAA transporter family protein [Leishmania donovani]